MKQIKELKGQDGKTLLSIVVPTYNSEKTIDSCIVSVNTQSCRSKIQLVIVDGASSDSTLSKISELIMPGDIVFSEKDRGIYDAMNKGINLSTGEWIYFLGSDDKIADDQVIEFVIQNLKSCSGIAFGDVELINHGVFKSRFDSRMYLWNTLHHQSVFYNRRLFLDRKYNLNFGPFSDYALNFQLYQNSTTAKRINKVIAKVALGGASTKGFLLYPEFLFLIRAHQINIVFNISLYMVYRIFLSLKRRKKKL